MLERRESDRWLGLAACLRNDRHEILLGFQRLSDRSSSLLQALRQWRLHAVQEVQAARKQDVEFVEFIGL